jgi:hypothetical protein
MHELLAYMAEECCADGAHPAAGKTCVA